jgi:hypothetical protein
MRQRFSPFCFLFIYQEENLFLSLCQFDSAVSLFIYYIFSIHIIISTFDNRNLPELSWHVYFVKYWTFVLCAFGIDYHG